MEIIGYIFAILVILFFVIIVGLTLWSLIKSFCEDVLDYYIPKTAPYPRLKFNQFKKFYDINPDRWVLRDNYVMCWLRSGRDEYFSFNFFDLCFYYRPFLRSLEKAKEKEKETKSYLNMIVAVKKDIADFEERSTKETNSKINEIWSELK